MEKRITLSRSVEENQQLSSYLAKAESTAKKTEDFFSKLRRDAELDPENFRVEGLSVAYDEMVFEYRVVFGEHFKKRTIQRLTGKNWVNDPVSIIMEQLRIPEVGEYVTDMDHSVFWDKRSKTVKGYGPCCAVAVSQEGCPFVCIFESGMSYIHVRTVLLNTPETYVGNDTAWIRLSEDGKVTQIIPALAERKPR